MKDDHDDAPSLETALIVIDDQQGFNDPRLEPATTRMPRRTSHTCWRRFGKGRAGDPRAARLGRAGRCLTATAIAAV
ncbi:hypothetical protein ATSB10_14450 [Dyella thiooxydans]|uniref:Uncharacterized protein n=1 Tax=Dyella thiooxydans TaxID=445710 RepID=A0A169GRU1_9GAMM|nr:hypothetical protein [Dyella thiooxydans]AND68899.1 hypothetical protein ATSB10_14450 [Dyella thiooxydans]